jgi:hypothetical protein
MGISQTQNGVHAMTSTNPRLSLDEVLAQFFFSASEPTPTMILEAVAAHPEYREGIIEFAALWAVYEATDEPSENAACAAVSDEDVARLQSFALNRLYELDHGSSQISTELPEEANKAIATLAGAALRRTASAIGFGNATVLLQKVVANRICDVPTKVLTALSKQLHIGVAGLQSAIESRRVGVAVSFSSTTKPAVSQRESWKRAVQALPMPEADRQRLLAMQAEE